MADGLFAGTVRGDVGSVEKYAVSRNPTDFQFVLGCIHHQFGIA